jgi:O-antigen ligase
MSSQPSAPAPAPPLAGTALSLAAFLAPPLAVFAPLALAPLLALLAAAVLAAGPRAALAAARAYAAPAALLALLALWAAATALWSVVPGHSLFEALRFLAIAAEGVLVLGVAAALPEPGVARVARALLAGLALSIALLLVDHHDNDIMLRSVEHLPAAVPIPPARYDRGVTVLLLLAFPGAARLALRRRWLLLGVLIAAVGLAVFGSVSHACKLAFLLAVPATLLALRLPRLAARLLLLALVLVAFLLPPLLPEGPGIAAIQHRLPALPGSAIHRLAIWRFTADAIAARPIAGWGMDASRALPGGEAPVQRYFPQIAISPNAQALPLHPHDAALQWRLELGLPGTLLALAVVALALERLARARLAAAPRALALGYAAAALAIALLSFGAWQAWWLSTLWLSAAALAAMTLSGVPPGGLHHADAESTET